MDLSHVSLHAEILLPGETERIDCPYCQGKDRTLAITREDDFTVLYQCFRASCDVKGRLGPSIPTRAPESPQSERKVFTGKTTEPPPVVKDWARSAWHMEWPEDWYYTTEYGSRIAMSVRSPTDGHRGWVLRNDGTYSPKALTYLDEGEVALSWYMKNPHAPTVLVEDIPSAVRASTYINAVALLGTAAGYDKAHEIALHAARPIFVALDQDATDQAIELIKEYSLLWDNPRVIPLQQDLKDMEEDTLCDLLKNKTIR